jgi:hypothetical protein
MTARTTRMHSHRRYHEIRRAPFEDEHGREYMPCRDSSLNRDGEGGWEMDARIPYRITSDSIMQSARPVEFPTVGETVQMFKRGDRTKGRDPLAEVRVTASFSDDGVTSSAGIVFDPVVIHDYATVGRLFAGEKPPPAPVRPNTPYGRPPRHTKGIRL